MPPGYHRAVVRPLPPIDTDQVAHFWQRFLGTGVLDRSTPLPETVEPFGDSMELADKLIGLVIDGPESGGSTPANDFSRPSPIAK
jgi:hypothetical protein